jgi:hypothetical protein
VFDWKKFRLQLCQRDSGRCRPVLIVVQAILFKKANMGLSVLDVINGSKWQRALFTTYALSLSFFESILLRSLRQAGCQEIWVVSDVQGYRGSLIERRSQGVGQEFRLVPVALRHGVFHPKCIYLAGPQFDALLIGSGNLTFGGFGRNLEVLEVLLSTTTPSVFGDFAGFLTAIETRNGKDLQCPDVGWVQAFRECALRSAGSAPPQAPQGQPRLIHTVESSVVSQLPNRVAGLAVKDLTVMSPFFDPDGKAVHELADALGCTKIRIAIPPKEHKSNFPFKEARKWGQSIEPVWVDTHALKRPLHAKWIEARGQNATAVLSGSINATTAALCTTRNVEVGVFRIESSGREWASWVASTVPPQFEPTKYEYSPVDELLLHAYLSGDGDLSGMVMGVQFSSGIWSGDLIKPSGEMKSFELEVRPDGHFRVTLPQVAEFSLTSGLQLSLRHGSTVARGWVHVEDILRMPRLPRLNIPAMLRLISRDDTEDDEIALLEYLAINATKHLTTFARRITQAVHPSGNGAGKQHGLVNVALADLAPTPTPLFTPGAGHSIPQLELFTLDRVFAQLRKRLLGHGESDQAFKPLAMGKRRGIEVEGDEPNPPEDVKRFDDALFGFAHEMKNLIDSPTLESKDVRGLYVIWFEVVMNMLLARRGDIGGAKQFMREWSAKVGHSMKASPDIDALEQHFVTCAATISIQGDGVDLKTVVHEWLENYYDDEVDENRARTALLPPIGIPFGILLGQVADAERVLTDSLSSIIASKTIRQYVLQAVEDSTKRSPIDASLPIFRGEAGSTVLRDLESALQVPRFKEQLDARIFCAKCYTMYPAVMERQLDDHRIALCSCGWLTIRTKR